MHRVALDAISRRGWGIGGGIAFGQRPTRGRKVGNANEDGERRRTLVSNLAGYSTESVAEFTMAVILEHIRGLEVGKQRGRVGNYS